MTRPTEYEITSLADFTAIPPDRLSACLADFGHTVTCVDNDLRFLQGEAEMLEKAIEEMAGGRAKMDGNHFTWIDDGVPGISAVEVKVVQAGRRP